MEPLKNIKAGTIKSPWSLINDILFNGGVMPKLYLLDNEASLESNSAMTKNKSIIS